MDKLQQMSVFSVVVETGGFARAARQLDLSPPVVTRAIADLESQLGVRLLTRTTRVVRVTEAGAAYAQECKSILAAVQSAEARALGEATSVRGGLRVTAPVTFGQMYFTGIVAEYLAKWPEADVSCLFVDRVVNLVEEGVDVAVRIGDLPDSSLVATRVGQVRRVLVASPTYLRSRGRPRDVGELKQHDVISTTALGDEVTWHFGPDGDRYSISLKPRFRSCSVGGSLAAAVHGVGIAQLLSYQVAEAIGNGQLELILRGTESHPEPVHVVHGESRQRTFKLRSFLDVAVERLRKCAALR